MTSWSISVQKKSETAVLGDLVTLRATLLGHPFLLHQRVAGSTLKIVNGSERNTSYLLASAGLCFFP